MDVQFGHDFHDLHDYGELLVFSQWISFDVDYLLLN